jgi:hypothetical protein
MSRGLGRIQRECMRVIERYEATGKRPTTFNITAEVYQVEPDQDSNRLVSDAQHVAVRRALANLRRKGLVSGCQEVIIGADGKTTLALVGADGYHAERCCFWSIMRPSRETAPTAPPGLPERLFRPP